MQSELITVEYAGPAPRQVGTLPMHDVRAWWTVRDEGTTGRVKLAAGRELKRHINADHVECVTMDMDTYNSPNMNAMITFRVLTAEQFTRRAELCARVYKRCDGCSGTSPGQLVTVEGNDTPQALCYGCWHPISERCKVLHWIKADGRLQV